jgi:hypothetical protein
MAPFNSCDPSQYCFSFPSLGFGTRTHKECARWLSSPTDETNEHLYPSESIQKCCIVACFFVYLACDFIHMRLRLFFARNFIFLDTDGLLTYLSNKVPGMVMSDIRKAASRVSLASVQFAALTEYVCGAQDRHYENALIDRYHAQPWLIDFANSFVDDDDIFALPSVDMPMEDQREQFMRALWAWHPDRIVTDSGETLILPDVLTEITQARSSILQVLDFYHVQDEARHLVHRRLLQLERLAQDDEPTLEGFGRIHS